MVLADSYVRPRFALTGYDWGGRAAAIAAALHPDRVRATVLVGGYTVQNTVARRGENAVLLGASSSISREIRGLRPATTYTVGAYIKDASDGARLSVALPESGSFSTPAASAGWQHVWVTFTTGSRETSAVVEVSSGSGADGAVVDDMSVAQAPPALTE